MSIYLLIITSLALSMDAFAVAVSCGISKLAQSYKDQFRIGIAFGFFQAIMPVIGWVLASRFAGSIQTLSHIIAFCLLIFIGGKMIYESRSCEIQIHALSNKRLLVLAIATSIDAMASGISFALLNVNILQAAIFIGLITFFNSFFGAKFGSKIGHNFEKRAEILGGIILIVIAFKILIGNF